MRPSRKSRFAAVVSALLAWLPGLAADAGAADPGTLHRQILEIVHGDPRSDVIPAPYYCARRGLIPDNPRVEDFEWYIAGKGACSATYVPDLAAIHSPLSDKGEISHFFFDDGKYRRLENTLTELAGTLETARLSLGDQLDLQITMWELIAALQFRRDIKNEWDPEISQPKVDRLLVPALRALRATLFTREQVAALPSTLPDLAELSGVPEIRPWTERLLAGDEAILEDLFPSQLHNSFSQGRLFSRVFVTVDDAAELERLRAYLSERPNTRLQGFSWQTAPPLPAEELSFGSLLDVRYLPSSYAGLRTILVLFFNVLDTAYEVVPTPLVAVWNELWWSGKLDRLADLRAADPLIGIRIVNYRKQFGLAALADGTEFPVYRPMSEDAISRVLFTNVNPVYPDAQVTTVRGQCLSCHSTKLMTFDMHRRKVGFVRPLSLRPGELYDREEESRAGRSFRDWARHYLGPIEGSP